MDQVKLVEDSFQNIRSDIFCLSRSYHFKFHNGYFPQIYLGSFFNLRLTYSFKNKMKTLRIMPEKKFSVENSALYLAKSSLSSTNCHCCKIVYENDNKVTRF